MENFGREIRKNEHLDSFLKNSYEGYNYFKDIFIEHNSLPELDFDEIDISCEFLAKRVASPIMINAITGGTQRAKEINESLARLALKYGLPIALGSQKIAISEDRECRESFSLVRSILGDEGIVIANLSANSSKEDLALAVEMLKADAIGLHLNVAQELAMGEGDRSFRGLLENIAKLVESTELPIIVKEVGFGLSAKVCEKLWNIGVKIFDLSGSGGTNFIAIEDMRNENIDFSDIYDWGNPTPYVISNCIRAVPYGYFIASGGIKGADEIIKSLVLGADFVALSGVILRNLMLEGYDAADKFIGDTLYKLKMLMLLTSSANIEALGKLDYRLSGKLKGILE